MKFGAFLLLFAGLMWGQGQPAIGLAPGTPAIGAPGSAPAAVSPDSVVIEVAGKKYTAAELDKMLAGRPPAAAGIESAVLDEETGRRRRKGRAREGIALQGRARI